MAPPPGTPLVTLQAAKLQSKQEELTAFFKAAARSACSAADADSPTSSRVPTAASALVLIAPSKKRERMLGAQAATHGHLNDWQRTRSRAA